MTRLLLSPCLLLLFALTVHAQSAEWTYIRPSNTGLGGDYLQCIRVDACGNKWTGGYLPFFSEGSVTRFNEGVFTCWSNFENYLPADRVYDIAFDNNEGVWVATNGVGAGIAHGGIAHYDGFNWTQYTSANSPLPEDDMRGITVDHNNQVWATFYNVSTGDGGISKFDGTAWTIYTPSNSGLQSGEVDKIMADAQNNIWIGTNLGLVKFDGFNWILYTTQNSGLSNNNVTDVEFDATTNKIYAAVGNAIDIFDGTTWTHINQSNSPVSGTGLWAVDAHGDSVIITTVGGSYLTYIYDGISWVTHPEFDHTYDARIDHEGNFWICGIGFLEKYDGTGWTSYTGMNTGLTSMFNNDVFVDSKNRAWFGSSDNGGINMFDCPKWQDYNPYNFNLWEQPVDYTGYGTGITEDSYGDIWMVFNGVAGAAVQVVGGDVDDPAAWKVWDNNNSGVSLQFMYRTAADHSGNVWFGYDQACSVTKYSHASNSWTNYNLYQLGQITCGAGSGIKSIRVDDSNNVWVCGLAGLAKYDQANWTFYSYLNTPMQQGFVMDIAFDEAGNKWIATEHGLYKFDGATWTKYDPSNSPMAGEFVNAVLVDKNETVWVAAGDQVFPYPAGLYSFDGNIWTSYTTTNSGLQEKNINRLAMDTLGNIWVLSEGHGASIFNPGGVTGYDCLDKSLQFCIATAVDELPVNANQSLSVFPNPASTSATISFHVPQAAAVSISILDLSGRTIKSFSAQDYSAGQHEINIDVSALKSGIYFCQLKLNETIETVKLVKN